MFSIDNVYVKEVNKTSDIVKYVESKNSFLRFIVKWKQDCSFFKLR